MANIFQAAITTIITIWTSIKSLVNVFHQRKIESIKIEELKKEEKKEAATIEKAVEQKDIDKLNELAGWK